ncbi:MAG TPA: c-type cytochrome [Pyrinomonadaceae bacterium]|jgi:cytochrome c oxidase cbb3-type subunit 3
MKNSLKLTTIFLFLVIFVSFISFRSEASRATENENNIDIDSSRSLYLNNCARCHGADGKSDTELGRLNDSPDISGGRVRKKSVAKLTQLISKGKGSMPGFGKRLTKAQISSLANYVRGL